MTISLNTHQYDTASDHQREHAEDRPVLEEVIKGLVAQGEELNVALGHTGHAVLNNDVWT